MEARENDTDWPTRLLIASTYESGSTQDEHDHFRSEADSAPIEELEVFLSTPAGKHSRVARAVMQQVYSERIKKVQSEKAEKENRTNWWRGLIQQVSAQIISSLALGLIIGFVTGVWFCK